MARCEIEQLSRWPGEVQEESPRGLGRTQILLALGKTDEANAAFAKARERKPGLNLTLQDTLKRLAP